MAVITATAALRKIRDSELEDWLEGETPERRQLIVEAAVPARQVTFRPRRDGRPAPTDIRGDAAPDARAEILEELRSYLAELLGKSPTVLRAAGALVVEAGNREARQILRHPLVKAVRPNRRLG